MLDRYRSARGAFRSWRRPLITNKVLLPGATVLERQVARIRNRAQERVWSLLTHGISAETTAKLEALLRIPDGGHVSVLDRLRKGPFLRSAPELVRALGRIDDVRELGINLSVSSAFHQLEFRLWLALQLRPKQALYSACRMNAEWPPWLHSFLTWKRSRSMMRLICSIS